MPAPYMDRQMLPYGVVENDGARAQVLIPEDWERLSWPHRRSIASHLSSEPITSARTAAAVIRAELKRRG